jgi:hypothetical protein
MLQYQALELRHLTNKSKNVRLKANNFIESQKRKITRREIIKTSVKSKK